MRLLEGCIYIIAYETRDISPKKASILGELVIFFKGMALTYCAIQASLIEHGNVEFFSHIFCIVGKHLKLKNIQNMSLYQNKS